MSARRAALPALLVLPLLFLAAELVLRHHGLPYWLWFNLDPSYTYLVSGMRLAQGMPPVIVEHPGTPVQILVAALLHLSPAAGAESILWRASTIILLLDAAALWLLGWGIRRRFGALLPALLAQTAPFLTMLALKFGIEPEPEPLLLFAVLLLGIGLTEEAVAPSTASLWLLAFAAGFGVAAKVTFAPLGLAPLFLIAGWRRRGFYVALAALWLGIWLVPEIPNLGRMIGWFVAVARDSGTYGAGPATVIDASRYPHNFIKLFFARPLFFVVFIAALAALAARWHERRPLARAASAGERALLGVLVAQLAQMLLVAKHPSAHYVLPALELSGPALAFIWLVLREARPDRPVLLQRGFAAVLALIVLLQSVAFIRQDNEMRREGEGARSIDLARDFPSCAHVYDFMASAPAQAWFYNDDFGGGPYAAQLKARMPANDYFSVPWRPGVIRDWDGEVAPADLASRYPCIALRGIDAGRLRAIADRFGPVFAGAASCHAGSETILVAGAACPKS